MFLRVDKYHSLAHEKEHCHSHGNSSHFQITNEPNVFGNTAKKETLEINISLQATGIYLKFYFPFVVAIWKPNSLWAYIPFD